MKVSEICLGTQTFGWVTDEEVSHQILDMFIEQGSSFLDTANVHSQGCSESILGAWLKIRANRRSLVLASKVFFSVGETARTIPGFPAGISSRRWKTA